MDKYHDIRQMIAGPLELRSRAHSENNAEPKIEYEQFYIKYRALIQDSHYVTMYKYSAFHNEFFGDQVYQLSCHT